MPKTPKSDEPCYTRKGKGGKSYTTCEGAQKKRAKQRKGRKRSPEENEQRAFLKLQKLKIAKQAKRPITGRIQTGPLNPGAVTSVSFPKPAPKQVQGIQPAMDLFSQSGIDTDLFLQVSNVMTNVAKDKGQSSQKQIDTELGNKFNPLLTRLLPANNWTPVKIFTYKGTGKGKVYEAYYKKDFDNQIRRLKRNPYSMGGLSHGSQASMNWGENAAHYTDWTDIKSSVIIVRDIKTKNIIGANYTHKAMDGVGTDDMNLKDEPPRRHFRFNEYGVASTPFFTVRRLGSQYVFPRIISEDLHMAPANVQRYYKYDFDKGIEGEEQENENPNDTIQKLKFIPALKDIDKIDFRIRLRY